jgi:hypothetical protein
VATDPKLINKPGFLPFKRAFVPSRLCFFDLLPIHVKIKFFATLKFDPDPHWFGSLDPDPDPHRDKNLDPGPH